ncbi:putative GTP-binding protein 6 [Belonocnema kinseyi]|uniref:putative GTP-binding protein 6 n=1 Tax=Belonocnema kinseyi TaxID=2817044 RepID=UPI00143DE6E2|nr:putative GTP-binding protein 6 [Belonocnema kinseyi]XP_033218778.1 putative GTP-binding protein 6 [Belonocnema kinseyi]
MHCLRKLVLIIRDSLPPSVFSTSPRISKLANIVCRLNHEFLPSDIEMAEETEQERTEYQELANYYLGTIAGAHRVFIIQPYIKWGPGKVKNTTPELQLAEAEALVKTLPRWAVVDKKCVPLLSLQRKKLVGSGGLNELKKRILTADYVTAVFISTNMLRLVQIAELQKEFALPVFDRYSIVIHIFRQHAKSPEAKLQVALAEIPYIWKKMIESNVDGKINLEESRKRLLQGRQGKLKKALQKVQERRTVVRQKRRFCGIPSVAIVGYTNCGKTSLIKALTGDLSLMPRNQLFATLDSTAHEGLLPSRMKIVYMDTIGFIQNVPEGLLAPFRVTFQDAIDADVIVHVVDVSHPDREAQVDHVRATLKSLLIEDRPVIEIANKCDLVEKGTIPEDTIAVSAKNATGVDLLRKKIEEELVRSTGQMHIRMRVASGSEVAAWLYKELTVTNAEPDSENPQYMYMDVFATELQMHKFKRFLKQ